MVFPREQLFLLYINDLPNCLHFSQPRMYADETSLTYASADLKLINDCVNDDLNKVYIWLSANKLTLNLSKTEFMLVGSSQKLSKLCETPSFMINDHPVMQVSTAKSLGVHIDQNLSWDATDRVFVKRLLLLWVQLKEYDILFLLMY